MEIQPHPESTRKALVTPEDLKEALFLGQAIPLHRTSIDFYRPYMGIMAAKINMINGQQAEPIIFSHRQLRWIGKRIAPWENPRIIPNGKDDLVKLHRMGQTILEYFGGQLAKGG